jgi:hypothetical protein
MAETKHTARRTVSDRASEFFQSAYESFLAQAPDRTKQRTEISVGDTKVQLDVAGSSLGQTLNRALIHLRESKKTIVDLTIAAWDTPGAAMIPPAWKDSDYGPRGEIQGFNDARFRTAFDHGTAALSMIDLETQCAIFWTRDATQLPAYESAAPLRSLLSWWLQARDCLLVHAAAIARDDIGILLAGAGGSGKSTTALACLTAGWNYLGDDYCALRTSGRPRVFSLYNSIKLDRQWLRSLPQFGEIAALPATTHAEKQIIFLHEHWPERIRRGVDCNLVLLPRVTNDKRSSINDATPAEALRALAPTSMFQTVAKGAPMFQRLAEFVRNVPARWLNLGREIDSIPDVIARCVEKLQ